MKEKSNVSGERDFNSSGISSFFVLIVSILLILNLNHNWKVSSESRAREFQYKAWQTLTKNVSFFSKVKNSDIFISLNQNDAFETNAGTFYANTGKRLSYMFNTRVIWPDFDKCRVTLDCNLTSVRDRSVRALSNLKRGDFIQKRIALDMPDDWVTINSLPGALDNNLIWAFDMFLLTTTTYLVYLVPFLENEEVSQVDFSKLMVISITNEPKVEFRPAIANVCLTPLKQVRDLSGLLMTEWELPSNAVDPSGAKIEVSRALDYSKIEAGVCAL